MVSGYSWPIKWDKNVSSLVWKRFYRIFFIFFPINLVKFTTEAGLFLSLSFVNGNVFNDKFNLLSIECFGWTIFSWASFSSIYFLWNLFLWYTKLIGIKLFITFPFIHLKFVGFAICPLLYSWCHVSSHLFIFFSKWLVWLAFITF